jgi:hypothetical protein
LSYNDNPKGKVFDKKKKSVFRLIETVAIQRIFNTTAEKELLTITDEVGHHAHRL